MRTSVLPMHQHSPRSVPQTSIILVVTEAQAVRQSPSALLREEGWVVLAVGDEAVACEITREHPLALIVLDVLSLQRYGFAIYECLSSSPPTRPVPLLLLIGEESDVAPLERCTLMMICVSRSLARKCWRVCERCCASAHRTFCEGESLSRPLQEESTSSWPMICALTWLSERCGGPIDHLL